jgi:hypothetical protein
MDRKVGVWNRRESPGGWIERWVSGIRAPFSDGGAQLRHMKLLGTVVAAMLLLAAACLVPLAESAIHAGRQVYDLLSKGRVAVVPTKLMYHRKQAGVPRKDGWYDAKSTEGHFRVSLPIPFNDGTIGPDGTNSGIGYMVGSTSAEGIRFPALEWVGLKNRETKEALKAIPESFRTKDGWKLSSERYFKYQNYPAVEFKVIGPQSGGWTRSIHLPDRMYSLTVEYPSGSDEEAATYVAVFFESLRIASTVDAKR